jgi:hypothetical protein
MPEEKCQQKPRVEEGQKKKKKRKTQHRFGE